MIAFAVIATWNVTGVVVPQRKTWSQVTYVTFGIWSTWIVPLPPPTDVRRSSQ